MPDITTFNRMAELLGVDLNYFSENFTSNIISQVSQPSVPEQPNEPEPSAPVGKRTWDMSNGNWTDADFSGLHNLHEKFSSSNILRCKFLGSDLTGLLLKSNNVEQSDFTNSNISHSKIQSSNVLNNSFKNCLLLKTEITASNLQENDFSGCDLSQTTFSKSNLYGCNLTGVNFNDMLFQHGGFSGVFSKKEIKETNTIVDAQWNRSSFIESAISDLVFTGEMQDCSFENCAFTRTTFQNVTFINTFFKNTELKRVRFVNCACDNLTYEFLRLCKADVSGISLLP